MEYILITRQEELAEHILEIKQCKYIAMDTEFIRNNHYYPKLSLIQICYKEKFAIIIDCLANELDLSELIEVIYKPEIIKIFHSCRQDLEIFYYKKGYLPPNIFDTQIAVLLINFAKDLSYDKIVKMLLNIELDKSSKNSNWLKRPLSKKQITYAANDVLYLYEVYQSVMTLLERHNKLHYLEGIFDAILDEKIYTNKVQRDINKLSSDLTLNNLPLIRDLLEWRENLSQKLDLPRNMVLNSDKIKELSKTAIENEEDLKNLLDEGIEENHIKEIFEIIKKEEREELILDKKINLSKSQSEIYNILKILLSNIALANKLHEAVIASNDDLVGFIINQDKMSLKFMKGWRYDIFGKLIEGFMEDEYSLKIKNNKIVLEKN